MGNRQPGRITNDNLPQYCNAVDPSGNTPLMNAVRQGNNAVFHALLARPNIRVNVQNPRGKTALDFAVLHNRAAMAHTLLAMPGININGDLNLTWAARNGHTAIVQALLAMPNVDVNAANSQGSTALTWVAEEGHTTIVQALLAMPNINVNAASSHGNTALMYAAAHGHTAIVQALLVMPNINVNAANSCGSTALMCAAAHGHTAIVQVLLAMPNVNIYAANSHGGTALMWATEKGHTSTVQFLLSVPDIDIYAANKDGHTAVEYASGKSIAIRNAFAQALARNKVITAYQKHLALTRAQATAALRPETFKLSTCVSLGDDINALIACYLAPLSQQEAQTLLAKLKIMYGLGSADDNEQNIQQWLSHSRTLLEQHQYLTFAVKCAGFTGHAELLHDLQKQDDCTPDALQGAAYRGDVFLLAKLLNTAPLKTDLIPMVNTLRSRTDFHDTEWLSLLALIEHPKRRNHLAKQAGLSNLFRDSPLLKQARAMRLYLTQGASLEQAMLKVLDEEHPTTHTTAAIPCTTFAASMKGHLSSFSFSASSMASRDLGTTISRVPSALH